MGTTWSAKWIQLAPPIPPATVNRQVTDKLEALEQQFSTYRDDSTISRFNRTTETNWCPVPVELAHVADRARAISRLTAGAFDATVAPLLVLWGFGPKGPPVAAPTEPELTAARVHVGWRKLEVRLSPPALRKVDPAVALDLSSIAKGFAVDTMSELLAAMGITNHLVSIGGDLRAAGPGPNGHGWRTGIARPLEGASPIAGVVTLSDQSLSTSGTYRNLVTLGDQRVGHIVDPRTGTPVAGALASVSVCADSCAVSSALATGLFVLGAEPGYALAVRENLACLFLVHASGAVEPRATPRFEAILHPSGIRERE